MLSPKFCKLYCLFQLTENTNRWHEIIFTEPNSDNCHKFECKNHVINSITVAHLSLMSILRQLHSNTVFVRCSFYSWYFSRMENISLECECVRLITSWCNVADIHWLCSSTSCMRSHSKTKFTPRINFFTTAPASSMLLTSESLGVQSSTHFAVIQEQQPFFNS